MNFKYFLIFLMLFGCSSVQKVNQPELAKSPEEHSDIQPPGESAPVPQEKALVGVTIDKMMSKADEEFMNGNYKEATRLFRNIVELQKSTPQGKTAEALYKIGMCHEMLGDDAKAIATYQDALKRKKDLTFELGQLEIPARLAMAYLRLGQMKTAKSYFIKAERGVAKLRSNLAKYEAKSQWLAQILYGMGFVSTQIKNDKNFEDTIHSIQHAQNYLLFAIEINDPKWSPLAAAELEKLYSAALENLKTMELEKIKDTVLAQRKLQEKQRRMAFTLLDQITNLNDQVIPEVENKFLKETLSKLASTEQELENIVSTRPVGEGLTDEAKKFENVKREGRIKDQ